MANRNTIQVTILLDDKGSPVIKQFFSSTAAGATKVAQDVNAASQSFLKMATAVGVGFSAVELLNRAISLTGDLFKKGFNAVDDYKQNIASLAAVVTTFSERQKGVTLEQQWQKALQYSTSMVPVLEKLAAKTLLSGQETTALANAFARSGVFLDASNAKQIEAFTRISNALPLMTQGQSIMMQINSEIRGVMTGQNAQSSMMLQTLKAMPGFSEKNLKLWRQQGTVLEHIGELLSGFGPATGLLEKTWRAVKSTIDTTATEILRGVMKPAYDSIIESTQSLNAWMEKNKDAIIGLSSHYGDLKRAIQGTGVAITTFLILKFVTATTVFGELAWAIKNLGFIMQYFAVTSLPALLNPLALVAIGVGVLATAFFSLRQEMDKAEKASSDYVKSLQGMSSEAAKTELAILNLKLKEQEVQYQRLINTRRVLYPEQSSEAKAVQETQYLIAATENRIKALDKLGKTTQKNASLEDAAGKKALKLHESIVEEIRKNSVEIEAYGKTQYERDIIRIDSEAQKRQDAGHKAVDIAQWYTGEITIAENKMYEEVRKLAQQDFDEFLKLGKEKKNQAEKAAKEATRLAADKLNAERSLYKDLKGVSGLYYQGEAALIEEEAKHRKALLLQGVTDAKLAADLIAAIDQAAAHKQKLLDIEKLKSSGNFFDGVKAGIMELEKNLMTWGKVSAGTVAAFASAGSSTLSTFFKDAWAGNLKSAGEYFDSFASDVVGKMADLVSRLIAEQAVLAAVDWAKSIGGGVSSWLTAKEGMWSVPGGGENGAVPIIAHEGEMILTKGLAKEVRSYLTESTRSGLSTSGSAVAGISGIVGAYFGGMLGQRLGGDVGGVVGSVGGGVAGTYAGAAAAKALGLTYTSTGAVSTGVATAPMGMAGAAQGGAATSGLVAAGAYVPAAAIALIAASILFGWGDAATSMYDLPIETLRGMAASAAGKKTAMESREDYMAPMFGRRAGTWFDDDEGQATRRRYIEQQNILDVYAARMGREFDPVRGYAGGGDFPAFKPFWAGEGGRELIFPTAPGRVLNHEDSMDYAARTGGSQGGRPVTIHIHNEIGGRAINSYIYNESKNGTLRLHERGIVNK